DVSGSFTLTTADIPVEYKDGKLVKKDGFSDEDAANYLKNIVSVTVGENSYNASGKRSTKIILEDGSIDFAVQSGGENIFANGAEGSYTFTVKATGYTSDLTFTTEQAQEPTEAPEETSTTTSAATTTTKNTTNTTTAKPSTTNSKSGTNSPKTGVADAAIPAAGLALAAATAFALRKKND
ncbi:MAG TPA: NPXTG-anchored protein, partial [Ruminococcus sp.]|nr:NPXTG-anchored protein [Ruminococcus sp.]